MPYDEAAGPLADIIILLWRHAKQYVTGFADASILAWRASCRRLHAKNDAQVRRLIEWGCHARELVCAAAVQPKFHYYADDVAIDDDYYCAASISSTEALHH